ncbi:hypothetical protein AB664_39110 [Brucella anthropi]|uniref:Uncharacterized protein n=1 Tax=Brucella anthropi TaxID=529 RepID=A0A656Z4B4_BRUAN|nr:hypothetical protein AB664_39110 [Brucella anthropi]
MTLKIRTGGVYKDARGYEVIIVMRYPTVNFMALRVLFILQMGAVMCTLIKIRTHGDWLKK